VDVHGVTVIGWTNFAARVPVHGSMLYAKNVQHLVLHLWGEAGLALDFDDEIVAGAVVIHEGRLRDGGSAAPAAAPRTATGPA
jgi:NAD(P) transhydrogenase subunit alpha